MDHLSWLTLKQMAERFPNVEDELTIRLKAYNAYKQSIASEIFNLLDSQEHTKSVLQNILETSEYLVNLANHKADRPAIDYAMEWFYRNVSSFTSTNLEEIPESLLTKLALYQDQLLKIVK